MSDPQAFGYQEPTDSTSEYSRHSFAVDQTLGRVRTIMLVKVVGVSVTSNAVTVTGTVDVQPLVNMVDGVGQNSTQHATVYGLPFLRNASGRGDVVLNPTVGDIGVALICDRDISNVKTGKALANPASGRRFDLSDGIYLGSTLTTDTHQSINFRSDGIRITDVNGNFVFMTPSGFSLQDKFNNTIEMYSDGISLVDKNNNRVFLYSSGVQIISKDNYQAQLFANFIGLLGPGSTQIAILPSSSQLFARDGVGSGFSTDNAGGVTMFDSAGDTAVLKAGNFTITGNLVVTGTINIGGGSISSSGGTLSLTTLNVTTVNATTVSSTNVNAGSVALATHVHSGVTTGAGLTGGPI